MILSRRISRATLAANERLRPVCISQGALGQNIPARAMRVSRQHRMLVNSPITQRMFGRPEALVAAIKLIDLPGVYVEEPSEEVTYFHLLFDDHEVIFAEGAPTESFFLGPVALKTLPDATLHEITEIFPDLKLPMQVEDTKHLILRKQQQAQLITRHKRRGKDLVSAL